MPRFCCVIAEPLSEAPFRWISEKTDVISDIPSRNKLLQSLPSADALVVRTYTQVDRELLDSAPKLKVIARAGVGLDNIDLQACGERNIAVVHTPCANTEAVVEYVTSIMLQLIRPIVFLDARYPRDHSSTPWESLRLNAITPKSCNQLKLGIVGLGKIGTQLARVGEALSMSVVYNDIEDKSTHAHSSWINTPLLELAQTCDVISIHVDGRASNDLYFNTEFFDSLKQDAILINSSRGRVIDNEAAARFARDHQHARLVLDVHHPEPIDEQSPFNGLHNVIRTPHIAAATKSAKENMSWVVQDVWRVLNNETPIHLAKSLHE